MDFDVLFLCSYIFQVCNVLRSCNMDFNVVFVSLFIFFQVCDVFPWILSSTFSETWDEYIPHGIHWVKRPHFLKHTGSFPLIGTRDWLAYFCIQRTGPITAYYLLIIFTCRTSEGGMSISSFGLRRTSGKGRRMSG